MSKPSGGIRSLPSLSACGLPTPIVVLACICDADIRVCSGAGVSILPPLKGEGDLRSWWRGSAEIFCSCFRFHRRNPSVKPAACQLSTRHALRVPFQGSLFCLVNFHQQNSPPEGHTGGCCRRNTTLFTLEIGGKGQRRLAAIPRRGIQAAAAAVTLPFLHLKLGGRVSGDSPQSPGGAYRRLLPP